MPAKQGNVMTTSAKFKEFQATHKLTELAKHPFDLTKEGNLTPQRIKKMVAEACGYKLLYATERVTDEVISTLNALAKESHALEKMASMQAGDKVNYIEGYPSENRPALHTAMRDLFGDVPIEPGALEAVNLAKREHKKLKAFVEEIDKQNRFTDVITIGMGGSDLGPKAIYMALKGHRRQGWNVHFISNIDPDDAAEVLKEVDPKKTLVLVISKSGKTLETLTNEALVWKHFEEAGLNPQEHFVAITGEGSPMDDPKRYRASFYIWDFIGGRYSVTSMVGAVSLSLALGYDKFMDFLRGAHAMDRVALIPDINTNLPLMDALLGIWNRNFLDYPTVALIPYSQALVRFPAHIQQVDMESNGKHIDKHGQRVEFETGPIIWGEPGTSAQHSFYQLIHQGTSIIPLEFIGFKESQDQEDIEVQGTTSQEKLLANLFAQTIALATGQRNENPNKEFDGNRPSRLLLAHNLSPFSLGALLALFEHRVVFQGFIWGINSFDQEGVQLGKVLAEKIIDLYAAKRTKGKASAYPLGEAFINHLDTFT